MRSRQEGAHGFLNTGFQNRREKSVRLNGGPFALWKRDLKVPALDPRTEKAHLIGASIAIMEGTDFKQ